MAEEQEEERVEVVEITDEDKALPAGEWRYVTRPRASKKLLELVWKLVAEMEKGGESARS